MSVLLLMIGENTFFGIFCMFFSTFTNFDVLLNYFLFASCSASRICFLQNSSIKTVWMCKGYPDKKIAEENKKTKSGKLDMWLPIGWFKVIVIIIILEIDRGKNVAHKGPDTLIWHLNQHDTTLVYSWNLSSLVRVAQKRSQISLEKT